MKLKDAYTILELDLGASPEEAKKRYRELTKKFHPDVNKDPGAEAKFKKINEAYQIVQNGKGNELEDRRSPNKHNAYHAVRIKSINITTNISFKESVLGCKRDVKYSRLGKCQKCNGAGEIQLNNGCKRCGGKGQIIVRQGISVMISSCPECRGHSEIESCSVCNGEGSTYVDASVQISIPAGILDGMTLRLHGMGNYAGSFMGFTDQYTDVYCYVTVTPEPGLSIDGKNVISRETISLLDALTGCKRTIKTIFGDKEIAIKPQSKNYEEVIVPNCGVGGIGNQKVVLEVQYPKDTEKLINLLNEVS